MKLILSAFPQKKIGLVLSFLFFCLLLISCESITNSTSINKTATTPSIPYAALLENVKKDKAEMKTRYLKSDDRTTERANAKEYIENLIVNKIAPYWYGTTWDFNGITSTPNVGNIACGYFITTVLRDAGFKIECVKLAQQAASVIIKNTCEPSSIKTFTKKESAENYIKQLGKGIYIVGLNCHVIFAYNDGHEVYAIHSNYTGERKVLKENFNSSRVNQLSDIFVVGSISAYNQAIDEWILN